MTCRVFLELLGNRRYTTSCFAKECEIAKLVLGRWCQRQVHIFKPLRIRFNGAPYAVYAKRPIDDPELHQREMRQIVGIEDERMLSWQGRSAILPVPQTEIPTFEWVRKASAYSGGVER